MQTEVQIQSLGHKGDGIADGPLYVPFALPGETVSGEITEGRLENARIITPSEDRVKAPCRHFKTCGGCVLQHASDSLQAKWRIDHIETALAQQGLNTKVKQLHVSPPASRRRAGFTARRTKSGAAICFNRMGSHDLVDLESCAVLHPNITSQFDLLRQIARMAATRKAPARLFVTASATGLDIAVSEAREISATEIQQLGQLGSIARITWNDEIALQNEEPVILTDGIALPYPSGAFLQATGEGQSAMVDFVKAATTKHNQIADLFAGCGTFSLPLTRHAHVTAFESDRDMLSAAEKAWNRQTDLKPFQTQPRDLFRSPLQVSELKAFDAVVLDPPRAGATAQVAEIAKSNLTKLVYVSCNPASFARDAKTLTDAGFSLFQIEAVDQFRWSPHIELMSVFTR